MWSEAAEAFMRENYPYHSNEWMVEAIEQKFRKKVKPNALRMKAYRMGIKLSKESQNRRILSEERQIYFF